MEITAIGRRPPCDFSPELGITFDTGFGLMNADIALDDGTAAQTALNTALNTGGAAATLAANQVALQTDVLAAIGAVAVNTSALATRVTSARLAALRTGEHYAGFPETKGFSAGDLPSGESVWLKSFVGGIDQRARNNGREGYSARTSGIAVGWEKVSNHERHLGVAVSYADTDVDGDGDGNAQLELDSYQAILYGGVTKEKHYVEWHVAYVRNQHDTQRTLTFGGLNTTARGGFNSNQLSVGARAGKPMNWVQKKTYFTPVVGLSATYVMPENYTETGAGELNLTVNPEDVISIVGVVGAKVHQRHQPGNGGMWTPFIKAEVNVDFLSDELSATGQFTGGGNAFSAHGTKVEPIGGAVGVGVDYEGKHWSFNANYDFDWRPGQLGNAISLEAKMNF